MKFLCQEYAELVGTNYIVKRRNKIENQELKEQAKQVLKDIQRRIQSSENYGEWHAANQIINFWNDNIDSIDIDEYTNFWIDFYALIPSMKLI